jgi:glycosyltransferase involved in cell wall biosynthesis
MALFVTHSGRVGGAEIALARYLERRPHHAVLLLEPGPSAHFFERTGATVYVSNPTLEGTYTRRTTLPEVPGALTHAGRVMRSISKILRLFRGQPIITNSMKAHVLVPPLASLQSLRVGIRLHDILTPHDTSATSRAIFFRVARLADSVAAVSRAAGCGAEQGGIDRVTYFYNGLSIPDFTREPPDDRFRILIVSQLARWKGIHHALNVVAALRSQITHLSLDIVGAPTFGDAVYESELRTLCAQLGISDVVTWHGHQSDVSRFYRRAQVLLHFPEAPDPLPTTLIEAQLHGVPVIANTLGGIPEIVRHGESGFLTDGVCIPTITRHVQELRKPAQWQRVSQIARSRSAEKFSLTNYLSDMDSWIRALEFRT